ncbi:POK11 protein, partial [Probosciger aterrimus]|nr:POK11 protein [Probosciger aterrimus]
SDPFLDGAIEVRDTLKLTWKTDTPIWVDQWPLPLEKLRALQELVMEQLMKGHVVPSTSPWNSPVFVIKKQTGKWRLLHDLRKINDAMEDMGALQPGLPSPTMIPRHWHLTVIDLKDCFFNIPLHPDDAPKFAFSVPSVNMQAPLQRYQWVVLPQGMKNSPTICQWYVGKILSPIRTAIPTVLLYHYMDDILVAAQHHEVMEEAVALVMSAVNNAGLCIMPQKVQKIPPWKYLGWRIRAQAIIPQPLQIDTDIQNLHDIQKLLGTINWVLPLLGISNGDLGPLFELLKGDTDLRSPRSLGPEAIESLQKVAMAITSRQAHCWAPELPFYLIILNPTRQPHALIFQWDPQKSDPLLIIEWVFLPNQSTKTILMQHEMFASLIIKARQRLLTLSGIDFACICLPVTNMYLQWLYQQSGAFTMALADYMGQLTSDPPSHKLLNVDFRLISRPKRSDQPLQALAVFTDGSGKSHKSVILWWDDQNERWDSDIETVPVFRRWSTPLNLITDSAYVAGIVERAEASVLCNVSHLKLFALLQELIFLLDSRPHPYFIMHIRSHTSLPG